MNKTSSTKNKILKVCWLPFIQFKKFKSNLEKLQNKIANLTTMNYKKYRNNLKKISLEFKSGNTLIIDSLGYIYYEINSNKKNTLEEKSIISNIINSMSEKNKEFIKLTFLNPNLTNTKEDNDLKDNQNSEKIFKYQLEKFIEKIFESNTFGINNIKNISLETLKYKIKKSNFKNTNIKLSIQFTQTDIENKVIKEEIEKNDLHNIINRNIVKLLEKSIFFTKDLKFEEYEVYELNIFENNILEKIINKISKSVKIYKYYNDTYISINHDEMKEIINNLIKKAIQDSIEEKVLLSFLKEAKNEYIVKIYDKIHKINEAIKNKSSVLLSVISSNANKITEEDIELFIHQLLQSLPHFKAIDNKIKKAYYIKIGNTTTYTQIHQEEMIEYTIDYQNWKNAITYFENMALEIKNSLSIFHQNKSLKELENISYFQNYQTDIDDLKSIQSTKEPLHSETKSYLNKITFFITTVALAGTFPLFRAEELYSEHLIKTKTFSLSALSNNFIIHSVEIILNSIVYFIFIYMLYLIYTKAKYILKSYDNKFYYFETNDFDKHEHRSVKPILSYENKSIQKKTISYNDLYTAYNLIDKLKNATIYYRSHNFKLIPELLNEPTKENISKNVSKDIIIRETYRVSRQDKVTTQIMLRYKVFNLKINHFIKLISYNNYLNFLKLIEKKFDIEKIDKYLEDLKSIQNDATLTLYVVYSFNLKLKDFNEKSNEYIYEVFKDHFRVHYNIDKLPIKNTNKYQYAIAEFIYFYFIARFKNFHNILTNS